MNINLFKCVILENKMYKSKGITEGERAPMLRESYVTKLITAFVRGLTFFVPPIVAGSDYLLGRLTDFERITGIKGDYFGHLEECSKRHFTL